MRRASLAASTGPSPFCGLASNAAALLLYTAAFFTLYLDGAASPVASPLAALGHPGSVLKTVLGGEGGRAWDMTLVVPTTATSGREAQALYAATLAATPWEANLVLVQGGGGSRGSSSSSSTLPAVESALGGRVRRLAAPCPDASDIPSLSVAWHAGSHFTCKVLEGLCAAVAGGAAPRYVALVAEGAMLRWTELLRARLPDLQQRHGSAPLVLTHITEEWNFGLPEAYANSKPTWPRMPLWNSSTVLSGGLAAKLCRLHAGSAPLDLHGPPEMQLGMLLSTLEGVAWVHEPAMEAGSSKGAGCPEGLTVTGMSREAWAACLAKASLAGDAL